MILFLFGLQLQVKHLNIIVDHNLTPYWRRVIIFYERIDLELKRWLTLYFHLLSWLKVWPIYLSHLQSWRISFVLFPLMVWYICSIELINCWYFDVYFDDFWYIYPGKWLFLNDLSVRSYSRSKLFDFRMLLSSWSSSSIILFLWAIRSSSYVIKFYFYEVFPFFEFSFSFSSSTSVWRSKSWNFKD